jgi:hypothetical protein
MSSSDSLCHAPYTLYLTPYALRLRLASRDPSDSLSMPAHKSIAVHSFKTSLHVLKDLSNRQVLKGQYQTNFMDFALRNLPNKNTT